MFKIYNIYKQMYIHMYMIHMNTYKKILTTENTVLNFFYLNLIDAMGQVLDYI